MLQSHFVFFRCRYSMGATECADPTDQCATFGPHYHPAQTYSQVPNIPASPDALHEGIAGRSAILRVDLLDASGKSARLEVQVTAACASGDTNCARLCSAAGCN